MMIYDLNWQMELILRIMIASVLGYLIGFERKSRDKSAGMRTHSIVALGAALMMIVSKYGFYDCVDYDASRVAYQIVSGIGFLGAGVIFVKNNNVSGLTTAAGLWTTAGVGMAIGAGCYFLGIASGLLVLLLQVVLHKIRFLSAEPVRSYLKVTTNNADAVMEELKAEFEKEKIRIKHVKVGKGKEETKLEFDLIYPSRFDKNAFVMRWSGDSRVTAING